MRRLTFVSVASIALSTVALFALSVPSFAQSDGAETITVTALHAIPGENDFPADVYLNGELAIAGFTMMMRTDPFELAPGPLEVAVFAAGADPATATPAVAQTVELTEPGHYVLVAQLNDAGEPILAVYADDLSPIAMSQARIVFRQTADIDPVDVSVGGETLATSLANSGEVVADLAAGIHELTIAPTSGGDPLLVTDVELVEGELTAVFVISTVDGGIDLAFMTVSGLQSTPAMVQTGTGGMAASTPGGGAVVAGLALVIVLGLVAGLRRFATH